MPSYNEVDDDDYAKAEEEALAPDQWRMRIRFTFNHKKKARQEPKSSGMVVAIAAAPHSLDIVVVRSSRLSMICAHSLIQQEKEDLMVLKCTIVEAEEPTSAEDDDDECAKGGAEVVLKIRHPCTAFQSEGGRMLKMLENEAVSALMPHVHAFLKFELDGKSWGGMCSGHYSWSVNNIVYPGASSAGSSHCPAMLQRCSTFF